MENRLVVASGRGGDLDVTIKNFTKEIFVVME
jgi:hypothetical protein